MEGCSAARTKFEQCSSYEASLDCCPRAMVRCSAILDARLHSCAFLTNEAEQAAQWLPQLVPVLFLRSKFQPRESPSQYYATGGSLLAPCLTHGLMISLVYGHSLQAVLAILPSLPHSTQVTRTQSPKMSPSFSPYSS